MPDLITMQKMKENQIHNSAYNAKSKSKTDGVYVCKDEKNKVFEFIPLEKVKYNGMTLKEYFDKKDKEYVDAINSLVEGHNNLIEAINSLAEHVDGLQFL